MKELFTLTEVADILSVSKETLRRWDRNGKLRPIRLPNNYRRYPREEVSRMLGIGTLFARMEEPEENFQPFRQYRSVELFAGAGGLALGFEQAGIESEMLVEFNRWACETLRRNRPNWNVVEDDVSKVRFDDLSGKVDIVAGGFPCQAFSYAGKKLGFEDARGTLFFEFARAVREIQPLICVGENVRGLTTHDGGRTIEGMSAILDELGYEVQPPQVLKAIFYRVPQKRERLFLVALKKGLGLSFKYPQGKWDDIYTVGDALRAGRLYPTDVPDSPGQEYPEKKRRILEKIPPGGYWKDLPEPLQREYLMKSFYLEGGKTGMARRMSWDEPSLTLTTAPAQKQTERCHPEHTRPFTTREYARIQTFPDSWEFSGPISEIYRQIGNAVPVNLAEAIARQIVHSLNEHEVRMQFRRTLSV